MVCKEDVITWFKEAAAYRRIDVMCSMLNMCVPFELRFLGTCIEEQGKHDYQELRGAALTANDLEKLSKELCSTRGLFESCTRHRLTIYLSLLQSHNYHCANWIFNTLLQNEPMDIFMSNGNFFKDVNLHTELLLLFTLALNHPAFTFEQRRYIGEVVSRLTEPESPVQSATQNPPPCPPGLGYFKPPLPVHHMPLVVPKGTHTELQGPPGIPLPTVHGDFMHPHGIWARTHYINTSCPPPDITNFPPPVSPLVSQQSSPSHSRSVSPSRLLACRPPHTPLMTHMERLPPPVKDFVVTNSAFNTDLKTVPIEEMCHGDAEKVPWMDPVLLPPNIKMPNGLLPVTSNKCQPVYLAGELQALNLDGEATLQCSSSSSSNSSDCQTPPDTPTDTSVVTPHGPGRGDHKMKMNGANLPPGLGTHAEMTPNPLFNNCSVPYSNHYPIPPFHNRSMFYSQAYRPQFPPYHQTNNEIIYPFPVQYLHLPYSSPAIQPTKATCFNCGMTGHVGTDCKELSIEEITQKRGYHLEYKTPPPDSSADKQ